MSFFEITNFGCRYIAEYFRLNIWMSMPDLFPVDALQIRQEDTGKVYIECCSLN